MKRILATVALLFLLLRPVCDVLAAATALDERRQDTHAAGHLDAAGGSVHEHEVPCCADIDDGAVTTLSGLEGVPSEGKLAFASPARTAVHPGVSSADVRHPPGIVVAAAPFYARSARIRR